jgi:hypothetical protein
MMFRDTSNALVVSAAVEAEPVRARPAFIKPQWWDKPHEGSMKTIGGLREIVKSFISGGLHRRLLSQNSNGRHFYFTKKDGDELWLFKDNPSLKLRICIAKKVNGLFIGNASSIEAMRQSHNKKIVWLQGGRQMRIQSVLSDCMPMVPFRMFQENKLDLDTFEIIEKRQAEILKVKPRWARNKKAEDQHFTGAMLFSLKIRSRSQGLYGGERPHYYLFDCDRGDLEEFNFNPFLSQLPGPVGSIAEAYDILKPQEVRDAERFLKAPCPRQGEWFFVPVVGNFEPRRHPNQPLKYAEGVLQAKGNRAHTTTKISEEGYVSGTVSHSGWEHLPKRLEGWFKPVANGATVSFRITGGID